MQEVQRVQVAPVDQTPVVLSDLDPLDGATVRGTRKRWSAPRHLRRLLRAAPMRWTGFIARKRWMCRYLWRAMRRFPHLIRVPSEVFVGVCYRSDKYGGS